MKRPRHSELENVDLLGIAPIRLAAWEETEGRVTITRPRPTAGGLHGLAELLSFWMSVRRIRLDEVGSFCWKLLDGRRTVGEVAVALRERFGEAVEPAEERAGQFVRVLRYQDMLAYPGWDEVPPGS
ncbi:MAG TPA: PqqD family protein [Acidobacteria bacterium]|nr:PqqD family protein [Acidobacteriota bacterium]